MYDASELRKGVCFQYKGAPVIVVDVSFSTPTARGGGTIAKTKMRNLLTGQLLSDSLRSGEKFSPVDVERSKAQYLYSDADSYHFMEAETYEQFSMTAADIGDSHVFLHDGMEDLQTLKVEGSIINVELPDVVVLDIRTPGEYAAGHLPGAVLMDCKAPDFADQLKALDPSKTYVMH